jgi:hypothetical protein
MGMRDARLWCIMDAVESVGPVVGRRPGKEARTLMPFVTLLSARPGNTFQEGLEHEGCGGTTFSATTKQGGPRWLST